MSPEVQVGIGGTVATLLVGILGGIVTHLARLSHRLGCLGQSHHARLSLVEQQTGVLWQVYGLDALRDARSAGLTERHSPEAPTARWLELFPATLRAQLMATAEQVTLDGQELPISLSILWLKHGGQLQTLAETHQDLTASRITGVLLSLLTQAALPEDQRQVPR